MTRVRARERNRVKDSWLGAVIKKVFIAGAVMREKKLSIIN